MSEPRPGDALVRTLVTFGRILREAGLEVGPRRVQDALCALAAVDLRKRDDVYWALRCTLVARRDDIEAFDAAFAAWFERAPVDVPGWVPDLGISLPGDDDENEPAVAEAHRVVSSGDDDDGADDDPDDGG